MSKWIREWKNKLFKNGAKQRETRWSGIEKKKALPQTLKLLGNVGS